MLVINIKNFFFLNNFKLNNIHVYCANENEQTENFIYNEFVKNYLKLLQYINRIKF